MLEMRNFRIGSKRSSVRLEPAMWEALEEICRREGWVRDQVVAMASAERGKLRLTSALRAYILNYFRAAASDKAEGCSAPTPKPLLKVVNEDLVQHAAADGKEPISRPVQVGNERIVYLRAVESKQASADEGRLKTAASIRTAILYFLQDAKDAGLSATALAMAIAIHAVERESRTLERVQS